MNTLQTSRARGVTPARATKPRTVSAAKWTEIQFRELIERVAEVCWEATRAHLRSEHDVVACCDPRVPRKWLHAEAGEQHLVRQQVLQWWNGTENDPGADVTLHVCRAITLAYKAQMRNDTNSTNQH